MTHEEHLALNRTLVAPPDHPGAPYLEVAATYAVHNRYLRIALFFAALVIAMFAIAGWRLAQAWADRKPVVVRINPDGSAGSAGPELVTYRPKDLEIRHFLMRFVREHYGRVRATAKDDFQKKLYFLSAELARREMDEQTRTQELQNFLISATEEADIFTTNVAIEDLRQPPYKARVSFDKIFRSVGSSRELRKESYVAQFQFTFLDRVPNNFTGENPLGLVITYFREDQAFTSLSRSVEASGGGF